MTEMLWTDYCFLAMLLLATAAMTRALCKESGRMWFGQLMSKPKAVSAAIVLMIFLLIAVLDCLHLESSNNNATSITVLDNILAPLNTIYEKTYSAPMALTLFGKENIVVNGMTEQVYPRLVYPPEAIKTTAETYHFVFSVITHAAGRCLAILGCLIILLLGAKPALLSNKAFWSGALTLFCCLLILLAAYRLSRYFHLFGTGKIGQDLFYYTVKSVRTGLIIGTLTTLFMLPLALLLGVAAGYFGGLTDDVIQYLYTTLSSVPGVLLITASVLSMQTWIVNHPDQFATLAEQADARLLALCLILGVTSWTSLCRLLRAEALKLREIDFVSAAKALGSSSFFILRKHLLPNVMSIVLITLVLDFSFLVLAEAVLSYVGAGVSPMTISWGNMINSARLELAREPMVWWPVTAAFVLMFALVLASNIFADELRDSLDPHRSMGGQ